MSTASIPATTQLADLIGSNALADAGELASYRIGDMTPVAVARPTHRDGMAAILSWADRTGAVVYPVAGRTQLELGNPPAKPGIALDLGGLNRLVDFQPADLTVTVEAGMTIAQLHSILAPEGKHVPIAAPLAARATIGGTLATGISGPLRGNYGLPRDWLIGVSVVDARGVSTNAGGKVVKNVTGYDLNRVYAGSLGTLAVITEATFKLAPASADWATVTATFADADAAVAASQELQRQHYAPLGLHILNRTAAGRVESVESTPDAPFVVVAMIGGRPSSVRRRWQDTARLWGDISASICTAYDDDANRLIQAITDLPAGPDIAPTISMRINAPPSSLADLVALGSVFDTALPAPGVVADVGFGGGRLLWWDCEVESNDNRMAQALAKVQEMVALSGGSTVIERCPASIKRQLEVWWPEPSGMNVMRRLKAEFDPRGTLNPGRFIGGL
jgi:glycolate oxidase FAD binding subunit